MNNSNKNHLTLVKPIIISFIGMMGSGKTKIGKKISQRLNYKFYDIDTIIEKKNKMKISTIFENFGESFFRDEEMKTISRKIKKIHLQKENTIISLGGGGFENISTRKLLLDTTFVVWLDCPLNVLMQRVGNAKNRPMLKDKILDNLSTLLKKRKNNYNEAHIKFDTSKCSSEHIIKKIKEQFNA